MHTFLFVFTDRDEQHIYKHAKNMPSTPMKRLTNSDYLEVRQKGIPGKCKLLKLLIKYASILIRPRGLLLLTTQTLNISIHSIQLHGQEKPQAGSDRHPSGIAATRIARTSRAGNLLGFGHFTHQERAGLSLTVLAVEPPPASAAGGARGNAK